MSGRKAKQARRELGEDAIKAPKRPTTRYLTKKERQEKRRRQAAAAKRAEATANKLAAAFARGRSASEDGA
jgi:hypothetical protein